MAHIGSPAGAPEPGSTLGGEAQASINGRGAACPLSTRADAGGAFVFLGSLAAGAGPYSLFNSTRSERPSICSFQEE